MEIEIIEYLKRNRLTVITLLDGARKMSPIPPPFRNPWLSVVTIHMMSESQALSRLLPPDSGGPSTAGRPRLTNGFDWLLDEHPTPSDGQDW